MLRRRFLPALAFLFVALQTATSQAGKIPARLTDQEFWALTERISEQNGQFQSDNFLSNEQGYQIIIPQLLQTAKQGGVYLGVGPEQNFPYILALKPALAIIFDIRRGNLHEHLLYKALFEMSSDRAEFLSKLFSRARPAGLDTTTAVATMMEAYRSMPANRELYDATLKAVEEQLTKKHGFALHATDMDGIAYVFSTAFYAGGPDLTYNMAGRGGRGGGGRGGGGGFGGNSGTYGMIQSLTDGTGLNRGFLGSEANWRAMKDFHERNLLVPVVGDFAGPKAIRTVGAYLKEMGATVSAYYLSNVEQYLNQNGVEQVFLCNVAQLPLDAQSTFIYTGNGRYGNSGGGGRGGGGGLNVTFLRPMQPDTQGC
jgi:uncharacterized membrane protein YgcG